MMRGMLDPKELGQLMAYAQVGMEMVAPIALGVYLDYYFGWQPVATLIGVLLGFVGGISHLVVLANRQNQGKPPQADKEKR